MTACLAVALSVPAVRAQDAVPKPAPRAAFERVLYLHGGPARDEAFWSRVKALGFTAATASIGEDPGLPAQHGLRLYGDQLAGKGVLELRAAQFDPVRDRYEKERDPRQLVRPSSLAEAAVIDALVQRTADRYREMRAFRPVAVSVADEPSFTRHVNPLDLCAADAFVAEFRTWLEARYGDLARLDATWNTAYTAWSEIEPWTADRIRARELQGTELPRNLAPWNDQLEFADERFAHAVHAAIDGVSAVDDMQPCGITGMQPPSAYGGYDYRRLMPGMTFFEAYPIGGARELAASLADPDTLQYATLFPPGATDPASMVDARLASLLAHGTGGVIVWSAGDVFDESGEPTRFGADLAHAWERLAPVAERFGRARIARSPVWIVESQPSVRAHWMIDSSRDGARWIRRLSSYEADHSTSMAARRSWILLLQDLGLQPRFVAAADLPARLEGHPPALLVLPATLALSDAEASAIGGYVERGGRLVADHGTGIYDEHLRRRERGALDELFGLSDRSFRWSDELVLEGRGDPRVHVAGGGPAIAERGLHGRVGQNVQDGPGQVQIEARAGEGRATYLNLAVCEYASMRLDPERIVAARDLRSRVRRVLDDASVVPPVFVSAQGVPTCLERVVLRASDGARLLAVRLNALDDLAVVQAVASHGPVPVELDFPAPVELRDLLSGNLLSSEPRSGRGGGQSIRLEMDPWVGAFLQVVERGR